MIDDLVLSGRETARAHYDFRVGAAPQHGPLARYGAINASNHGIWPTGGAWLALHPWERYQFSGDREFLARRAYPVMKEAALFFADYLVRDPKTGQLISGPSNSPEQGGLVMGRRWIIRSSAASSSGRPRRRASSASIPSWPSG